MRTKRLSVALVLGVLATPSLLFADDPYHWPYGPIPAELLPKAGQPNLTPPAGTFQYVQFVYGRANKWDADPEGLVHNGKFYIFYCAEESINNARTDVIRVIHKNLPVTGTAYTGPVTVVSPVNVPWTYGPSRYTLATGILPNGSTCAPSLIYFPGTGKWYVYFTGNIKANEPPAQHSLGQQRTGVAVSANASPLSTYTPGSTWINLVPTTYTFDPNDTRWWYVHGEAQASAYLYNEAVQFAVGDTSYYVPSPTQTVQRWRSINVGDWAIPNVRSVVEPYRGDGWKFAWSMSVAKYPILGGNTMFIAVDDEAGNGYIISGYHGHVASVLPNTIPGANTDRVRMGLVRLSDGTLYTTSESGNTYGWTVFSMTCVVGSNCNSEHNIHLGKFRIP